MRRHWLRLIAVSLLVVVPCFWHRHIEAGDLGSHLYNAWLARLIDQGRAPGLWIARQWQNVLFDVALSNIGGLVGLRAAERICVGGAALLFFWSVFAMLGAASRRAPWVLMPCIAMMTYGWTFHAGLFNYYISCALAFLGLAIFWRGSWRVRAGVLVLAPLLLLGQVVGVVFLIGAATLLVLDEWIPARYQLLLPLAAAGLLAALHAYVSRHFRVEEPKPLEHLINGTDQFAVFGSRYEILAAAVFALGLACIAVDVLVRRREGGFWARYGIPFQLYLCAEAAILLLPSAVYMPQYGAPFSMTLERVSLFSAAMACGVLAAVRPRWWHAVGFGGAAAVFFAFLYQDTGTLSRMEDRIDALIRRVPPGARVMETIATDPEWRNYEANHMVDRACIGHCFAVGNYEPATRQFRVRAREGNRIVMTSHVDTEAMERGDYRVQPRDLPAYQINQCSTDVLDLCARNLASGETNNGQRGFAAVLR
ncbi:MAG TPA: hypothetical protein VGO79_09715 [Thermoanaerobaculia bacterium]